MRRIKITNLLQNSATFARNIASSVPLELICP